MLHSAALHEGFFHHPCTCIAIYSCGHKKREGQEPSLFVTLAPAIIVSSTGTVYGHPSDRTSFAL